MATYARAAGRLAEARFEAPLAAPRQAIAAATSLLALPPLLGSGSARRGLEKA